MMPLPAEPPVTPVTQECMVQVAHHLQLPLQVLYGVLYTEGGTPGRSSKNKNGTKDLGPMQINDRVWLPFFKKHYGLTEAQLTNHGCLNVWAGGVLLRMQILQAGGDMWKGIGNYHSRTTVHHERYQLKVASFLRKWGVVGAQPVASAQYGTQQYEATQPAVAVQSVQRRY